MIVLDYEQLNTNLPKTEIEKAVSRELNKIRESKKLYTLRDPSPSKYTSTMRKLPQPPIHFRLNTGSALTWEAKTNEGERMIISGMWMQCKESPRVKEKGVYEYKPTSISIVNEMSFDPVRDTEIIFMFKNIINPGNYGLIVEDKETQALERNHIRRLRGKVEYLITSSEMLTDRAIRKLAYSRGVNAENLSDAMLRDELMHAVEASEKNKLTTGYGYEEFIRDTEQMSLDVDIRANIQIGIERNIIVATQEKGWVYANGHRLCVIPIDRWDKRVEVLVQKFLADKDAYLTYLQTANIKVDDLIDNPRRGDIDNLEDLQLKDYSKKYFPNKPWPPATKSQTIRDYLYSHCVD